MSINYSEGLSECDNKGVCGLNEVLPVYCGDRCLASLTYVNHILYQKIFEDQPSVTSKVDLLAQWLKQSKCVVVYCGAGISTSAGIPDFR